MLRGAAAVCVAGIVSGCSSVPAYRDDARIKPAELAQRVQCELKFALQKESIKSLKLREYSVGFSLTLDAETNINPNIGGSWTIPYHLGDTFSLGASAGLSDTVSRNGVINLGFEVAELNTYRCPAELETAYREGAQSTYGSFGIVEWLDTMAFTATQSNLATVGDLQYTVDFTVTTAASTSPGFLITNAGGTLNLPLRRTDKNTLQLTLTKIPPASRPLKVCVTNLKNDTSCDPIPKDRKKQPQRAPGSKGFTPDATPSAPESVAPPSMVPRAPGLSPGAMEELNRKLEGMRNNTNRLRLPLR